MHTGGTTMVSFFITILVLTASAFALFFTWVMLKNVDWKQTIDINIAKTFSTHY